MSATTTRSDQPSSSKRGQWRCGRLSQTMWSDSSGVKSRIFQQLQILEKEVKRLRQIISSDRSFNSSKGKVKYPRRQNHRTNKQIRQRIRQKRRRRLKKIKPLSSERLNACEILIFGKSRRNESMKMENDKFCRMQKLLLFRLLHRESRLQTKIEKIKRLRIEEMVKISTKRFKVIASVLEDKLMWRDSDNCHFALHGLMLMGYGLDSDPFYDTIEEIESMMDRKFKGRPSYKEVFDVWHNVAYTISLQNKTCRAEFVMNTLNESMANAQKYKWHVIASHFIMYIDGVKQRLVDEMIVDRISLLVQECLELQRCH